MTHLAEKPSSKRFSKLSKFNDINAVNISLFRIFFSVKNLIFVLLSLSISASAQVCGTSGLDGPQTATPPVNTYFPISANTSLTAGSKSITLQAVPSNDPNFNLSYGVTPIKAGDLILIIQMQDATFNYTNSNLYGKGSSTSGADGLGGTGYTNLGSTGKFEYVVATSNVPLTGGVLNFRGAGATGGCVNTFTNSDFTTTRGQRRFQIVRVPQFSNLILNSNITTPPYNGSVGGIIAFDVAGTMQFNGYVVDASERGFRGGYGPIANSGPNTNSVYAVNSTSTQSVGKGEGIAGTPRYMWDGFRQVDNFDEGLPGGSYGRGAPGNAGGGGNDHNSGGGGGANAGDGGVGGMGWQGAGGDKDPLTAAGRPGSSTPQDVSRLIMGGGGGGGDANNATTGVKGGVGGGIILINVQQITGAAVIRSNGGAGEAGTYNNSPDGAGGGGAGGTIFLRSLAASAGANLTLEAKGGKGGNTVYDTGGTTPHGPGGGGGGGFIYTQIPSATISSTTVKGLSGKTNDGAGITHGAEDGHGGLVKSFTTSDLPPYLQGGGSICYPALDVTLTEENAGAAGIRNPGTTATYKLKVYNNIGGGNAGEVAMDFQLPYGFSLSAVSASLTGDAAGPASPTFTVGATGRITFGTYNISPGDAVELTIVVNIASDVPTGIYQASAQATYLDPTRTIANPQRKITASNNAFSGSNTAYETGGITNIPGTNYDGDLAASTFEDVYINSPPMPGECNAVINGDFEVASPGEYGSPNYLGRWGVVNAADKVKVVNQTGLQGALIRDNGSDHFSLQQTINSVKPSSGYTLTFDYRNWTDGCGDPSSSKIQVEILDASTNSIISSSPVYSSTNSPSVATLDFSTSPATNSLIIKVTDPGSPVSSCGAFVDNITITSPLYIQIDSKGVSCNGDQDGVLTITALSGAGGPYKMSYSYNGGAYTSPVSLGVINNTNPYAISNLSPGDYTFKILDENGCETNKMVTVTQPNVLALTEAHVNVDCFGDSSGSIDVTVSGGTAPYTYAWDNGATTEDLSGLSVGDYTITVNDANGCSVSKTITIAQPAAALAVTDTHVNVGCFGGSSGSIDVTVSGGTGPYTYAWDNGATTEDLSGLSVGDYTITVNDANGCSVSKTITIAQPAAALALSETHVNVGCFGGSSGSIDVAVSGGTGPYTYAWGNGASTQDLTGLAIGDYALTVTDANGCSMSKTITIAQPAAALALTDNHVNVGCFGDSSGSIDVTVSGGTGPYTYAWDNGATTEDLSGLAIGDYALTVTDANGCSVSKTITIAQPAAALALTDNHVNVGCFGDSSGSIDVSVSGGTGPYTYAWGNGASTQDLTGLAIGDYTITVNDANGCSVSKTITIAQPAAALALSETHVNVGCFGDSSGSIDVAVSGGTAPYTYAWDNGATTEDLSGLAIGDYTITVNDANGCSVSKTITIAQPAAALAVTDTHVNVGCFGDSNGSIDVAVSGGTGPYTYAWGNGASTQDLSGLIAGNYTITVNDANGCSVSRTITIAQPAAALALSETHVNVGCFGDSNGSIDVAVSGGTGPYTYAWGNGASTQDLSGLIAGNYTITVNDANGCSVSRTITIAQPAAALAVTEVHVNVKCFGGSSGSIDVSVSGGTAPYTYVWGSGASTQDLTGLIAGDYALTVTDANGCSVSKTITIAQPAAALALSETHVNVGCFGGSSGSIDVAVSGGTAPYTYAWDNGATTEDLSGLAIGDYTITVNDANGCSVSKTITIAQPAAALAVTDTHVNVGCFGDSSGSIDVAVSGGTGPYTYAWGNGASTQDLSGLIAGNYTITVNDANGCSVSRTITIAQPAAALAVTEVHVNVKCFGGSSGSIDVSVSGGTAPYTYVWGSGASTQDLTGLIAGDYALTVTDANGCSVSRTITIAQPAAALALSDTHVNVGCFGDSNGSIDVAVSGGTAPYTYAWDNGATTEDLSGLAIGDYTITVNDANGCSVSKTITIAQPAAALAVTDTHVNVGCFGDSSGSIDVAVSGGTAPYTYAWDNGATTEDLSGLIAGNYTITVNDANGCSVSRTITIAQPAAALAVTEVHVNVKCFGGSSGSIDVSVSGGTAPYTYVWGSGSSTQDLTGLSAGNYTITVKDANNCTVAKTITITQPAVLTINETHVNNVCYGEKAGSINVTVTGGTQPYTYQWNSGETTEDLNNLSPGDYELMVIDKNGCSQNTNVRITPLQPFEITESLQQVKCYGENSGSIKLSLTGGGKPYLVRWSNGATGTELNNLSAGTYVYTAKDAYGCIVQKMITVRQPQPLKADLNIRNTTCKFSGDGSIFVDVEGGTAPYRFIWNGADKGSNNYLKNINAGKFNITIIDAHLCSIQLVANVLPGNCAPSADNDQYVTSENTPIIINTPGVIINDADPDDDELKINSAKNTSGQEDQLSSGSATFKTKNGTVKLNEDGSFTYTPDKNFYGEESFLYEVSDGSLVSNYATVNIVVLAVNDPPEAVDDNYNINEDEPVTGNVSLNDSDPDDDPIVFTLVTPPVDGTLNFNDDGTFTYTPDKNFFGEATFTYRVCDPKGLCDEAVVTINVAPVNDPPVAVDDEFYVKKDGQINQTVKNNDYDEDNDPLQFTVLTQPAYGQLTFNPDGSFSYRPNPAYQGTDTFTYRTCDPMGLCDEATVTLFVQPVVTVNLTPTSGIIKEGDQISITATLSEPLLQDVTVYFTYGGTATPLADYTLSGDYIAMIIPAGQMTTTQNFVVNAVADAIKEQDEKVNASIDSTSAPDFVIIGLGSVITITDVYPEPVPTTPDENGDINPDPLVSPNGDGKGNERFIIYNISKYPDNEVVIFNRWGNEVYRIKGYDNEEKSFKGIANVGILTNSNKDLVDGVYYYLIYTNVEEKRKLNKGYLILKR